MGGNTLSLSLSVTSVRSDGDGKREGEGERGSWWCVSGYSVGSACGGKSLLPYVRVDGWLKACYFSSLSEPICDAFWPPCVAKCILCVCASGEERITLVTRIVFPLHLFPSTCVWVIVINNRGEIHSAVIYHRFSSKQQLLGSVAIFPFREYFHCLVARPLEFPATLTLTAVSRGTPPTIRIIYICLHYSKILYIHFGRSTSKA